VFDAQGTIRRARMLSRQRLDDTDGEMILRRVQLADGRTRAFINDQPVSVQVLKAVGAALVEIHGQHDERALVDAATHRACSMPYAGLDDVAALERCGTRAAPPGGGARRASRRHGARAREADYLRHAVDELKKLAPEGRRGDRARRAPHRHDAGREDRERSARGAGRRRGAHSPVPALSAAVRRLERRAAQFPALVEPAVKAIDAAINALEEADQHLTAALRAADFDPRELERIEERLFALRAASRKYDAGRRARGAGREIRRRRGADRCRRRAAEKLEAAAPRPTSAMRAAPKLSAARAKGRRKLDKAVNAELRR
jgi:DNA repair protein RecN (Recombination protein N)